MRKFAIAAALLAGLMTPSAVMAQAKPATLLSQLKAGTIKPSADGKTLVDKSGKAVANRVAQNKGKSYYDSDAAGPSCVKICVSWSCSSGTVCVCVEWGCQ